MLVLHRDSETIEHRRFSDLPDFLKPTDLLVLNDSRVFPARLHDTTGKVEILLLEQQDPHHWTAMVRPGKKMRTGASVEAAGTTATVLEILGDGTRLLEFTAPPDLDRHGEMPIPPYIHRHADELDKERYQTVYAKDPGSVAAPTAGLHFSEEILATLPHAFVTLHVGAGTFHPVKTEDLSEHQMHPERYTLSGKTADLINRTNTSGGRIISVGTTTARVLESQPSAHLGAFTGSTDIFIRPPYEFQRIDALLTNFHLPGSTLLMLVTALAGRGPVLEAYEEAIRKRYRFFSYGDCMLIL